MRIPNDTERLTIYGKTGSGKTVAAIWHLSQRSYTSRPWIIFDFKGDATIAKIPHAIEISVGEIPKKPGLYIARPIPEQDAEAVDEMMWDIWARERIGVYIDEGYMVGRRSNGFNALLTQGRSKSIPMIVLSQRPVWMSRFVISEADFHQVFFLSDEADRDVVQRFIPYEIDRRLPKFHSFYYDVSEDEFVGLKPVPHPDSVLETFDRRLKKTPKFL